MTDEPTPQEIERAVEVVYRNSALLRTSLVSDKTEAFVRDIAAEFAAARERCAKIAEREPELPGEPDAETLRAMIEAGPVANARAATAATKKAIAAAIRDGK